jgi:hypothetical protein
MSEPTSFRSIIELWRSREGMASDIGAKPSAVSKWWQRDRIPDEWWALVLGTEPAKAAGLTADKMIALVARPVAAESLEARV